MPTIGAPLRKWTLLLLLCSPATYATDHTANDISSPISGATAVSTITTPAATLGVSSSSPSPSPSSLRKYIDSDALCPARTINYITHTLPQQCAKTSWAAPGDAGSANIAAAEAQATADTGTETGRPGVGVESRLGGKISSAISLIAAHAQETPSGTASESGAEHETDSPFDNASFLSFEEWKKKNLEQVGQSPENVGQGRAAPSGEQARRRPVNVNALDSLGDEGEIEIDFSGFGNPGDKDHAASGRQGVQDAGVSKTAGEEGKAAPSSWALSKDAGKTCKERFNYASFDCAATVLKTNKQAKSSTSILVENKDSYMLNECSAENKFLIVELCDDILVDTIVLANYEFFSSIFRHFRVSVSDRFPVKMERWRTLGTFEARNSRDIQAFLITEPQIWARYLRVEFLTQFGNEFYCPLSLLRVHGTTMMEQFRQEEEEARGIADDDGDLEAESKDVVKPAEDSGPLPPDQIPIQPIKDDDALSSDLSSTESLVTPAAAPSPDAVPGQPGQESDLPSGSTTVVPVSSSTVAASSTAAAISSSPAVKQRGTNGGSNTVTISSNSAPGGSSPVTPTGSEIPAQNQSRTADIASAISPPTSQISSSSSSTVSATSDAPSSSQVAKAPSNTTGASPSVQPPTRGSSTQPNPAVPSTQESFFKSIHKRLLYLEANSTLSLQYIEEQSRSLRDAFLKVEKRQLAKTEKFLDHLNSTVVLELTSFRNMYDQLWQSTVIELESMKERQRSEIGEIGARLSLLADELVWQKRMAVVQSTLLLACLGLVLFVRSGTLGSSTDVPIVQHLGSKYTTFFETPPRNQAEPGMARRRRTLRNMWRSDTSAGLSDHQSDAHPALSDAETDGARSPLQNEYSPSPPTPSTSAALSARDARLNGMTPQHERERDNDLDPDISDPDPDPDPDLDDQAVRIQVLETQSGPATPNGTRDCRPSWEEVDRAMDELKAEGKAVGGGEDKEGRGERVDVDKGMGMGMGMGIGGTKSPLRRAYSSGGYEVGNGEGDGHGHGHGNGNGNGNGNGDC